MFTELRLKLEIFLILNEIALNNALCQVNVYDPESNWQF